MIHLQYIGLLLACVGRTALAGLLPDTGANGYQYNRPSNGQNFGNNLVDGGTELGVGNRRGYTDRFANGFTGVNGFGTRPSTAYGTPSFGNNANGLVGGNGGFNNNGNSGFGNRPSGSYGQSGGGFIGGSQNGGYQQQNGGGGFVGGYQGTGNDGYYQGGGGGGGGGAGGYNGDNGRPQPYSFQYEVRDPPSGNDYAQQESSDGNVVRGEYRVLLPDSRTQIVKYTADDANGYNADVQYEGQAQFPRGGGGVGGGGGGGPGGYNQFGGDAGYQGGGFGSVNNYQGGRGGYAGSGGIFPSGGGISPGGVGGVNEPGTNGNRYLPPGNGGYGK